MKCINDHDYDRFQIRIESLLKQIKIRDAEIESLKEALKGSFKQKNKSKKTKK